jgi:monoamine oxidase
MRKIRTTALRIASIVLTSSGELRDLPAMPRTPILRALRGLADEHRAAEQVEAPTYTRGRLLAAGAGAVASTAFVAERAKAAGAPRIAIVGGGIAGLTAALTLADKGYASTIYEAAPDRVGGRMHSDTSGYWNDGQVSEWCGELIDTGHMAIRQLAQRFKLETVDLIAAQPNGTDDTYWFLGGYYPKEQADKDFQPIHNTLQGQVQATSYPTTYDVHTDAGIAFDRMSVYDWIESYVDGGHRSRMGRLLDVAYNIEYGAETRDQSALNLMYLLGYGAKPGNFLIFGKSDERFHIAGGNQRLPEAIASYLGYRNIKLGWTMQSVAQSPGGEVTMTFSTGGTTQTVKADHVILALPFAVLRTLDYSGAGFDQRKKTAITQMGAGKNGKLQLQFDRRYWNQLGSNGAVFTDIGLQSAWDVSRAQAGESGILVDYSGGNIAASYKPSSPYSSGVTGYAKQFLAQLEVVYPGIGRYWNGKSTLSAPFLDANLKLAYSYWKPRQYVGFGGYERVAQGNVHFAGEHTSVDFQGYMEGGASEGVRAAGEILALLK